MAVAPSALETVLRYHAESKHHLRRFAPGPRQLDWANQPDPFRRYAGAPRVPLPLLGEDPAAPADRLFTHGPGPARPCTLETVAAFLELSLGLSVWKGMGAQRWALRINPSSGNLHPTEAHLVLPPLEDRPASLCHYAPLEHALEQRAELPEGLWQRLMGQFHTEGFLVGLTSIFWREAWKYGVRAWRYCQLDMGHAIGCLAVAAALHGWRLTVLEALADEDIEALLALGQLSWPEGEQEQPAAIMLVHPAGAVGAHEGPSAEVIDALAQRPLAGRPSRLSRDHAAWDLIEEVAAATRKPRTAAAAVPLPDRPAAVALRSPFTAAQVIRRRRSGSDYDGRTGLPRETFLAILDRTLPRRGSVALDIGLGEPRVHLALFVHRVEELEPGLYFLVRNPDHFEELKAACRPEFAWYPVDQRLPLYRLSAGDQRREAFLTSCQQEIAGDSALALALIAHFQAALEAGPWLYRRLFWEAGLIGQVLYLGAEAHGFRGTGIGCFFDDAVHLLLGLRDQRFQDLYHFTIGRALEDPRLESRPAYHHLADRTTVRRLAT